MQETGKRTLRILEYRQSKRRYMFGCQDPEYAELSKWAYSQRCEYRRMVGGKDSILSPERVKALEGIGFVWNPLRPLWKERLSELADYRKVHGHCNVPKKNSENVKLSSWVRNQRHQYSLHLKGEISAIILPRIQALESLGFEWGSRGTSWEFRLSELADYRRVHGHCNVPLKYSENAKLATWVTTQRHQYSLYLKVEISAISLHRIQALESLGFGWGSRGATCTWEDRLSELADYRKVHGHCNVPQKNSENSKLGRWVAIQRHQYSLHLKGKTPLTFIPRIQALESLGFEWGNRGTAWEFRLSELADYRKVHGHCNVPQKYSENSKLGRWVDNQRSRYRSHQEGKPSQMTLPRIQALERLGFEWKNSIGRRQGATKKSNLDDDVTNTRERAVESTGTKQPYGVNPKNPTGRAKSTTTLWQVEAQKQKPVDGWDSQSDERDLDGSASKPAAKPSLSAVTAGDSAEANNRDVASLAKLPCLAHQRKTVNSFFRTRLVASPPENNFSVATKKPANSRQGAESQLETALSPEMLLRTNPVAPAEPLQQRHNYLVGNGSTRISIQTTPDEPASAPQDMMQQTPRDEVFESSNVLREEMV
jgi:transposase-like protein